MGVKGQQKQPKHGGVSLRLDGVGFKKRMLFNRFCIAEDGDFRLVTFAYTLPNSGMVVDHFACAFHVQMLERQKEENMKYLGQLGSMSLNEPGNWTPPSPIAPIEVATHFGLTRVDSEGEITLFSFSLKSVLDEARRSAGQAVQLPTDPIAMLRSNLEVHQHLIKAIHR